LEIIGYSTHYHTTLQSSTSTATHLGFSEPVQIHDHSSNASFTMAFHSLAIAKASLAAGMMRPDPTSIPRTEIAHFHVLLEAVLKQCSSTNIQV